MILLIQFAGYPNHTYWLPAHLILSKRKCVLQAIPADLSSAVILVYVNSVMASWARAIDFIGTNAHNLHSLNVRRSIALPSNPQRRLDSHSGIIFADVSSHIRMPAFLISQAAGSPWHRNHYLK